MKPEKKENIIFSYLAVTFLGILVITLVILAYLDNKNSETLPNEESQPTPKANILTEDEMERELDILSDRSTKPNRLNEQEIVQDSSEVGDEIDITAGADNDSSMSYEPIFSNSQGADSSSVLNFSGTIYKIQGNLVVVSDADGYIKVTVSDKTEISINGKKISIDSLEVGQKVNVEGYGDREKRELVAETVMVTGEMQVIPY